MRISLPDGRDHAVALVAPSEASGAKGTVAADRAAGVRAVELALAAATGDAVRAVAVRRRPGRPPLALLASPAEGKRRAPHAISVSHVDGRAVALVAPAGWRIGVDLERTAAVRDEYRHYFLADGENEALAALPAAACWALKEAAWKALQLGPDCAFRDLTLRMTDAGAVRAVALRGVEHRAVAQLAEPWPGYVLAALWIAAPEGAAAVARADTRSDAATDVPRTAWGALR